jgi:hypothetical protein
VKWLSLDYLVFNTNLLWDCIYLSWILISLWDNIFTRSLFQFFIGLQREEYHIFGMELPKLGGKSVYRYYSSHQ